MRVRLQSSDRMSNRQWHAHREPMWWARIGSGNAARFLDIGRVRGDDTLDVAVDVPDGTTAVAIGVGPANRYGIRETVSVAADQE